MTNAEAAQHFASLPPDNDAEILVIDGDTGSANTYTIEPPGTDFEYDIAVMSQPWMYYCLLIPILFYFAFFMLKWAALTAPIWLPIAIILSTLNGLRSESQSRKRWRPTRGYELDAIPRADAIRAVEMEKGAIPSEIYNSLLHSPAEARKAADTIIQLTKASIRQRIQGIKKDIS